MYMLIQIFLGIVMVISGWRIGTQYFNSIILAVIFAAIMFFIWLAINNRE